MELLRNLTIGQYVPRPSPIHTLDPRTKITATTVLMVVIFVITDFTGYALFSAFMVTVFLMAQIPLGYVGRGLRPVIFLLILTFLLNLFFSGVRDGRPLVVLGPILITTEAAIRATFIALRLVLLVVTTSLFTFTTSPMALTDGMERLLRPFRRIGVPGHELAMMMSIALRFIPTLLEETERIMKAQMARGAEFQRGNLLRRARALLPVLVPLFLSAFRRADELALAMEARAYRGGEGRTRMKELRFGPRDAVAGIVTVLVSAAFLAPRWLGLP
jgi:energy-coupling factor transport system permease protein